jgi:N-acyl-D-aspartate/D-glutamate deacylase
MDADLVIRGGTVVDGSGAAPVLADVAIAGDRVVAVEPAWDGRAHRTIDASGRLVTPGFVDIHTHLDAQLAWDPLPTSSCWHGVTSVVIGNCGVTFAPVQPGGKEFLAEMMESVEDIPRQAILDGLPWDWSTYGDYLGWVDRTPKGVNVGGMVGHCAVRVATMGERSLSEEPASAAEIAAMCSVVEEAISAGALGFSTSRTLLHRVPDGRPVPGTWATPEELLAIGDVLGRMGKGIFESAPRFAERDARSPEDVRAEMAWMGEVSRRSGRPLTFALVQADRRPDLYRFIVDLANEENDGGAQLRPQTTARGVGILFSLPSRSPFDGCPAWRSLQGLTLDEQLAVLRDPDRRAVLIAEADAKPTRLDLDALFVLPDGPARYDCRPDDSLAAHARRRGVSAAEAFIDLVLEHDGRLVCNFPFLNQSFDAIQEMLDDPVVVMGLADAGAHVGQIMDSSQPTFVLTYWVRERERWPVEEVVRRLTCDTAALFGIKDRGVLRPGAFADANVIDFDALTLHQPEFVHDFPGGAGRYIQRSDGYDCTIVNGQVFMEHGEHTGTLAGTLLRS